MASETDNRLGRARATRWLMLGLAGMAACGGHKAETGPTPKVKPEVPAVAMSTFPLSGEAVAVVPLSFLFFVDSTVPPPPLLADRAHSLPWADSVIGGQLEERAPEVKWVLPPALRKIALRSPGVASDPDRMGQSVMRNHELKAVPDPLRSSLRALTALAGGRHALIPASLIFTIAPDTGLRAELAMVMADTRTGDVIYRTLATGTGHTPEQALIAAMATVLPLDIDKK